MPSVAHRPTLPRLLHPVAWWLWAIGLATAASRTTNPLLLAVVIAVAAYVVAARREAGAASPFGAFVRLGLFVIAMRVVLSALLGGGVPGTTVLFRLPEVPLPSGSTNLRLGGPVSLEQVLAAAYEGARLAAVLACIGAANALASPRRLLRYVPATLYEIGTALVVGLTYAPQMVEDARRVRSARRLRGHDGRGPRELLRLVVPVLDGSLERALDLAASMESRGYGRSVRRDARSRRLATVLTMLGLGGVVTGTYGLLDAGSPPLLGLPVLALGSALAAAALLVGARRDPRSRYRPDPWSLPEWLVTASGVAAAGVVVVAAQRHETGLVPVTVPAAWPTLPWLAAAGVALAVLAAWASPLPPVRAALQEPTGTRCRPRRRHRGQEGRVIRFEHVGVRFADRRLPVLRDVDLEVPEGELALVVGETGSGKTTLLRCVNGLVPHFSGGTLAGRVVVDGRDTRTHRPRDLAEVVGFVGQDPTAAFVTDTVEEELAYGMESLGLSGDVMRKRVEETLDLLGLADVRHRSLRTLSGGQAQRVAIGGVLAAHPRVLVLDEPTSALDPVAAEEVLAALTRLVHDLGLTVLMAEHRLERVVQYADRVVTVQDGTVRDDEPHRAMLTSPVTPPVVELGRLAGWEPLPLSVREARRHAAGLRERLAERTSAPSLRPLTATSAPLLQVDHLVVDRGRATVLRSLAMTVHAGEVVAVMGRNGVGKSTLLAAAAGQLRVRAGQVRADGLDPASLRPRELVKHVGLVPQDPGSLLYSDTVAGECRTADGDLGLPAGTVRALLSDLAPDVADTTHPRDLSEGQRLALAMSIVLARRPPLLLLDEPTRGFDYGAKARLVSILRGLRDDGHAVVLASHDVELVAAVADRVALLAEGEIVADGPVGTVLAGSPAFAPQVAKVMHPQPWLTVADVQAALEAS